jgi:ABC-type uncharacterized transport system substrate-binding protein
VISGGDLCRRAFLRSGLAVVGVSWLAGCGIPFNPSTQPTPLRKIGWLAQGGLESSAPNLTALTAGLSELGYIEGQTIVIEALYAEGREERLPELAAELVSRNVDVILTGGRVAIRAAGQATTTVPIVFATATDVVADGLVESLARPGGNMTGLTLNAGEEHAKRMQLLRDAFPSLSRVAVLWNQTALGFFRETEAAAQGLGVQVLSLELRGPDELDAVLAGATAEWADSLIVVAGAVFAFLAPRITEFATRNRLPAMYPNSAFVDSGGLIVYAASIPENYRRAAAYVDRILRGAKPGDLPVEQPTQFDLAINLKTAREIGLTLPQSVLTQATEIIQ